MTPYPNHQSVKKYIKHPNGEMEEYRLCVARVQELNEDGTPRDVTLIGMDEVCELSRDPKQNWFITMWIPEAVFHYNVERGQ